MSINGTTMVPEAFLKLQTHVNDISKHILMPFLGFESFERLLRHTCELKVEKTCLRVLNIAMWAFLSGLHNPPCSRNSGKFLLVS